MLIESRVHAALRVRPARGQMKRILNEFCLACAIGSGCGEQLQPLCSGGEEIALRATLVPGGNEGMTGYTHPDGTRVLEITGDCKYVVNGETWGTTRTGTLDGELAARVERELHYRELPSMQGEWGGDGCYDASLLQIAQGSTAMKCYCGCRRSSTPSAVREAVDNFEGIVGLLMEAGTPFRGRLRLLAFRHKSLDQDDIDHYPVWPLEQPSLEEIAVEPWTLNDARGRIKTDKGTVFSDADDIYRLRTMIEDYTMRVHRTTGPLYVRNSNGEAYDLYGRDELVR
jgi:hypothetical protein